MPFTERIKGCANSSIKLKRYEKSFVSTHARAMQICDVSFRSNVICAGVVGSLECKIVDFLGLGFDNVTIGLIELGYIMEVAT